MDLEYSYRELLVLCDEKNVKYCNTYFGALCKSSNPKLDYRLKFRMGMSSLSCSKNDTLKLKAQREVISYRVPSTGDANLSKYHDLEQLLIILAEVAQFNSELLKKSIIKYGDEGSLKQEDIENIAKIEIDGYQFHDGYDYQRLDYLRRKMSRLTTLHFTMTEGMMEDFIGAWDGEEGTSFSNAGPSNWQIIFDIS